MKPSNEQATPQTTTLDPVAKAPRVRGPFKGLAPFAVMTLLLAFMIAALVVALGVFGTLVRLLLH